jgi:hypothetical protein
MRALVGSEWHAFGGRKSNGSAEARCDYRLGQNTALQVQAGLGKCRLMSAATGMIRCNLVEWRVNRTTSAFMFRACVMMVSGIRRFN